MAMRDLLETALPVTNYDETIYGNGTRDYSPQGVSYAFSRYRSGTWEVTPGWPKVKRDNPCKMSSTIYSGSDTVSVTTVKGANASRAIYTDKVSTSVRGATYGISATMPSFDFLDLNAEAIIELRQRIKDSDFSLPVLLAEAGETARLIGSTATSMARAMVNLKRGRYQAAAEAIGIPRSKSRYGAKHFDSEFGKDARQAAANGWLTLQYGWNPLLQDIYNAAEVVAKLNNLSYSHVLTARGSKSKDVLSKSADGSTTRATFTSNYTVRYTLDGVAPVTSALGLNNPAEVAWELIPYSFVVDWFYPVGNYLSSLNALAENFRFLGGTHSTLSVAKQVWDRSRSSVSVEKFNMNDPIYWNVVTTTSKSTGRQEARMVSFNRDTLSGVPLPQLPRLKNPLSLSHMASGLALLSQAFR